MISPPGPVGQGPCGKEQKRLATHSADLPHEGCLYLTGNHSLGQMGKEMLVSSGPCLSKYRL